MDSEFEQEFTVKTYVPEEDVSVSVTTKDDGSVFLKPTDDQFQISQSTDPQSFQDEVKAEIVDENGNYLYYLKCKVYRGKSILWCNHGEQFCRSGRK